MKKLGTLKISLVASVLSFLNTLSACGNLDTLQRVHDDQAAPVTHSTNNAIGDSNCALTSVHYPTTQQDFQNLLYGHRGFLDMYDNVKHLGHDIIYAEGAAMHPIGCGTVRFYGPAMGYGTLAAVVEHRLATSFSAANGDGTETVFTSFLSIYGHMRKSAQRSGGQELAWKVGDTIQPTDTIGYTQADDLNGDGPEHLHLGIRLQNATEAQVTDPSAWFRGYDTPGAGQYKRYYADPKVFMSNLDLFLNHNGPADGGSSGTTQVKHHPVGTLLHNASNADYWLVLDTDHILNVSGYGHLPKNCAVDVSAQTIACYWQAQFDPFSLYLDAKAIKFQSESQVYQLYPGNGFAPTKYRTFLSYESFLSWGFKDSDIVEYPVAQKSSQLGVLENGGFVGFMPGALVKGKGQSEVAVADQHGQRRPVFNWDVFQALGYKQACIYEIESATLDIVAGTRSNQAITLAETAQCSTSSQNLCIPGSSIVCACGNGVAGSQICRGDGQAYNACVCLDAGSGGGLGQGGGMSGFAGSGGIGGGGGNIGSTGQGGSQMTSDAGSGGVGGTQSSGGSGGYAYDAGSSGSAGTSGSGHMGGSGGSGGSNIAGSGGSSATGGSGGSGGTTNDAGTGAGPCQTKGLSGKTTFIINAPINQSNVISVFGWIHYPNWSGVPDVAWSGWAWGTANSTELVFQKGDAYQGAKYIFAPGVSSGAGQPQTAWYCEQTSCPIGTFVVCNGQQEACRVQNGALSGGASYVSNPANWQNIQCVLP